MSREDWVVVMIAIVGVVGVVFTLAKRHKNVGPNSGQNSKIDLDEEWFNNQW